MRNSFSVAFMAAGCVLAGYGFASIVEDTFSAMRASKCPVNQVILALENDYGRQIFCATYDADSNTYATTTMLPFNIKTLNADNELRGEDFTCHGPHALECLRAHRKLVK